MRLPSGATDAVSQIRAVVETFRFVSTEIVHP